MPHPIRFLLGHFGNGAALGLGCAEVILFSDFAHVRRLFAASNYETSLTALFFVQSALIFGTATVSVALLIRLTRTP